MFSFAHLSWKLRTLACRIVVLYRDVVVTFESSIGQWTKTSRVDDFIKNSDICRHYHRFGFNIIGSSKRRKIKYVNFVIKLVNGYIDCPEL